MNPSHLPIHTIFDIETSPGELEDLYRICGRFDRANVSPPATYKNPETIEKWYREQEEEYPEKLQKQALLNPALGKVCAIGYLTQGKIEIVRPCSEAELLEDYWARREAAIPGSQFLGYNNHGFDDEFLLIRSFVTGVPVPEGIHHVAPSGFRSDRGTRDLSVDFWGKPNAMRSLELTSLACGGPGKNGDGALFYKIWNQNEPEQFSKACDYLANDLRMPAFVASRLRIPSVVIPDPVTGLDCLVEPRRRLDIKAGALEGDYRGDDELFPPSPSREETKSLSRGVQSAILSSVGGPGVEPS